MGKLEREIETRLSKKRLDVFTDDFGGRRGAQETEPGTDVSKGKAPYGQAHDDYAASDLPRRDSDRALRPMAQAGRAQDQSAADLLDEIQYQIQAKIKGPEEQFPGHKLSANTWECDDCGKEGTGSKPKRCPSCSGFKIKALSKLAASDNAEFDPHQTDPARLSQEIEKRMMSKLAPSDEAKWSAAKKRVHSEYPELSDKGDRFWKIAMSIYESMGGK